MTELLNSFQPTTLEQMKSVRLMNRIDTKYIMTVTMLQKLLSMAQHNYYIQKQQDRYNFPYYTLYYDTEDCQMYMEHLRGKKQRQKIRIRKYESSDLSFLEVKNKNNKGRTYKKRTQCNTLGEGNSLDFLSQHSYYPINALSKRIENRFNRITLVNKSFTERLTIDTKLRFHNFYSDNICELKNFVVVELKRDGNVHSPILEILRKLRVQPVKFSKYCMGLVFTDENLKKNRFKPRIRMIEKICNITNNIDF